MKRDCHIVQFPYHQLHISIAYSLCSSPLKREEKETEAKQTVEISLDNDKS